MTTLRNTINNINENSFIKINRVDQLKEIFSTLHTHAVVFLDVDDTLITPCSKLFRWKSPDRCLIDDLKRDREKYPNFNDIISHWRLTRKTMLISEEWPDVIQRLQKDRKVYGLTKMETGAIGAIASMEMWRYEELKSKGITFTPTFYDTPEMLVLSDPVVPFPSTFYRGIFITGSYPKSKVVQAYLQKEKPEQIVFVDDRLEYLQDVSDECKRQNIPFLGVHFVGMENFVETPNPKVAEFQKHSLLEKIQWFEDEEAEKSI